MNQKAIDFIKQVEGSELTVYLDSAKLPTVGTGHLVRPEDGLKVGDTITQERADALLAADLKTAADAVARLVRVTLNENQEAALISFVFNVGVGAFTKSTLLRKLNSGDYPGAADQFGQWVSAGGRVVRGLINRRAAERKLFETPV